MRTVIVIPARYDSSRFPGKPLAIVSGKSMIERVWRIASKVSNADSIVVATDDERIKNHVLEFGGSVVMTSPKCRNGSERVYECVKNLKERPDIIVNLQGDALVLPPWVVEKLISEMAANSSVEMGTAAVRLSWQRYEEILEWRKSGDFSVTLVTFNKNGDALYFSRALIPAYRRLREKDAPAAFQHIGIYAYRYAMLERYLSLPETSLEAAESLEQLRVLEHGYKIRVVEVDLKGRSHCSVDSPADILRAVEVIRREGEL